MPNVPLDTRFIGIAPTVSLKERKSALINAETSPYTMQDIANTAVKYLSYVALLEQSGTDAPTAIVLQNDFDAEITYVRNNAGNYSIISSEDIFVSFKTWAVANTPSYNGNGPFALQIGSIGNSECILYSYDLNNSLVDLGTNGDFTSIEIRVYP